MTDLKHLIKKKDVLLTQRGISTGYKNNIKLLSEKQNITKPMGFKSEIINRSVVVKCKNLDERFISTEVNDFKIFKEKGI